MSQMEIRAGLAEINPFTVKGLSIVTDNSRAAEDINNLWERFFELSLGQHMPDKADDIIYAVYSDYQGDHDAPYRITVGYRIDASLAEQAAITAQSALDEFALELHSVACEGGDYAVMSAAGQQPKALIQTWEAIWGGDLPRRFTTDFELYGPRFFEDGVNEVLIHVGIEDIKEEKGENEA